MTMQTMRYLFRARPDMDHTLTHSLSLSLTHTHTHTHTYIKEFLCFLVPAFAVYVASGLLDLFSQWPYLN